MSRRIAATFAAATMMTGVIGAAPATAAVEAGVALPARVDQVLADDLAAVAGGGRVIAYVHGVSYEAVVDALADTTAVFLSNFEEVDVAAAAVTAQDVATLTHADGITFLEGEQRVERHLASSQRAIRNDLAPMMLDGDPVLDGTGTAVAILDTGVDADHPMFLLDGADTPLDPTDDVTKVKRQLAWECGPSVLNLDVDGNDRPVSELAYDLSDSCFVDHTSTGGSKNDTLEAGGHGTHVASTAAGLPMVTSDGLVLKGVAPGATILDLSVEQGATFLGANNGMAYVLRHQRSWCDPAAGPYADAGCDPIVATNHSYGPQGGSGHSPNSIANKLARALVNSGITISWSAGNDGGDGSSSVTNGTPKERQPGVVMVAAYDDLGSGSRRGYVASFSSRGAFGDPGTWPDIAAPGTNITAACSPTLSVCRGLGPVDAESEDPWAGTISGTSMAAPHVTGAIAVLQQAALATRGEFLSPADLEAVLKTTALPFDAGAAYVEPDETFRPDNFGVPHAFDKGVGLLDLAAAVAAVTGQVDTSFAEMTVTGPDDGSASTEGDVVVTGTVEHHIPELDPPTQTSRTFDDPDDDATSAYTEILDVTFDVTSADVVATLHVDEVWPLPDLYSAVSYSLLVDGRAFESFLYGPNEERVFDLGAGRYTSDAEASAAWDVEAGVVTIRVSRAYLAGQGAVKDNYYLSSSANHGGVGFSVPDDTAPNGGDNLVDVTGPDLVVAAPHTAVGQSATSVTFEHDGPNGNTFQTDESTFGVLPSVLETEEGHRFTLDVSTPSVVTFTLDWVDGTDSSDLDLYVTGAADSGPAGATGEPTEVVVLDEVEGTLDILVEPYFIADAVEGVTYTLTADVAPIPPDTDGDGVADPDDACPTEPATTADGCPDADGDGVKDGDDACPDEPGEGADGCPVVTLEFVRVLLDDVELGRDLVDPSLGEDDFAVPISLPEGTHVLTVEWAVGDTTVASRILTVTHITDDDGDGVPNADDQCPDYDDAIDGDGDGVPDGCDPTGKDLDSDTDGVIDDEDNCHNRPNGDQADLDGDGLGDVCDNDIDGDGHGNGKEADHGTDPYDPASYPTTGPDR